VTSGSAFRTRRHLRRSNQRHTDLYPYHNEPAGEWGRIQPPDQGGTASTFHAILTPADD
jgi:hypothetical protein